MIKLFFSFMLFCLLANTIHAQHFNVSLQEPVEFKTKNMIVKYGSHFISFEQTKNKMQLAYTFKLSKLKFGIKMSQYDKAMKLVKELDLSNGNKAFGPVEPFLKFINSKLYLVYFQAEDADMSDLKVFAGEVDTATMSLFPAKQLLTLDQKNLGLFKSFDLIESNTLNLVKSPDNSKVLAIWSSDINNEFVFSVLDADLNLLWTKKGEVNAAEKIELTSSGIDNKATVFAGCKSFISREEYEGHLIVCTEKGKNKDIPVRATEGKAYEVNVVASQKGDVVHVVGSYASEKGMLTGVYYMALNGTDYKQGKMTETAFTEEFLTQLKQDDHANVKGKSIGMRPMKMQAFELENGNVDMAGEFRVINFNGNHSAVISGNIVVVHFKNKVASFFRIPKMRASAGSTIGSSFKAYPYKDQTIVFYNDSENNLKRDLSESSANSNVYKDNVMVAATITEGQPVKREKIIDLKDEDFLALPEDILSISRDLLMVPCQKIKGLGGIGSQMRWANVNINP